MKVFDLFTHKGQPGIGITQLWEGHLGFKKGDVIARGSQEWEVIDVGEFHQNCFVSWIPPKEKYHYLILKPIGHNDLPQEGDILTKVP